MKRANRLASYTYLNKIGQRTKGHKMMSDEPTQRELYLIDQELAMFGDVPTYVYAIVHREATEYPIDHVEAHSLATARTIARTRGYEPPEYGVVLADEII